jgi:hypothetical protein
MMELNKKQQLATTLIIIGCIASFNSSTAKVSGPATSAFKIITGLGGAGCCLAGIVLQMQSKKQ